METNFARLLVLALSLMHGISCFSQVTFEEYNKQRQARFNQFRNERQKAFDEFRRKRNEEFAKFLRREWTEVEPSPDIPQPKEEPIPPVVIPKEEKQPDTIPTKPTPIDEVVVTPEPKEQPKPIEPIEEIAPPAPTDPTCSFIFYGTPGKVRFDKKQAIRLKSISENAIADAWLALSGDAYTNLVYDCLQIREQHNLCDWAYLMMLQQMAEAVFGKDTNESVLLMAFVYNQSGYKMRLANNNGTLYMMFTSEHIIFRWSHYIVDGEYYYTFNNKSGDVKMSHAQYPNERPLSLLITKEQKFAMQTAQPSSRQSKVNEEVKITIASNQNMLDFYASYPCSSIGENMMTQWSLYAIVPMPEYIKQQLYPQLRLAIEGCDQLTAVNKILNLIQSGFEYEYDDQIWGRERVFFPEETLHYPYCDCEDRSILLTNIVRDLLGLNCMLVYYPNHLAAAVEFTTAVPQGDYIEHQGRKFFIADPTILGYGAPVGKTMPGQDNTKAKVIVL